MVMRRELLLGAGTAVAAVGGAALANRVGMGSMGDYVAWLFRPDNTGITILPDLERRTPVVDPGDHYVFVSLGCAAENLALTSGAVGQAGAIDFDPAGGGQVRFPLGTGNGGDQALLEAIPHRQSTRAEYDGSSLRRSDLRQLKAAATVPGVDLVLVTERPPLQRLRDLVLAGNTTQIGDPAFVAELKHWLRFSPNVALRMGDGLSAPPAAIRLCRSGWGPGCSTGSSP